MERKDYGTTMYNGKKVKLTKDGLISKIFVNKEDRLLIDEARAKLKGMEKEKRQKELKEFLSKFSK